MMYTIILRNNMRKLLWIYLLCLLFSCEKFQGGVYYIPEADIYLKWVVPDSGRCNTLYFSGDTTFGEDFIVFDYYYGWRFPCGFWAHIYPEEKLIYIVEKINCIKDMSCRNFDIRISNVVLLDSEIETPYLTDSFPITHQASYYFDLYGKDITLMNNKKEWRFIPLLNND